MLVKWGTDVADREGLESHLYASPAGYSLYRKHGFKEALKWDFELEPWGVRGLEQRVWMIRPKHPS